MLRIVVCWRPNAVNDQNLFVEEIGQSFLHGGRYQRLRWMLPEALAWALRRLGEKYNKIATPTGAGGVTGFGVGGGTTGAGATVPLLVLRTSLISRSAPPTYWPLSIVAFSVSGLAYWRGCRGRQEGPAIPRPGPWHMLVAIAYLSHWFVVIPWVTLRMALLPKRLVWAKTSHGGNQATAGA